MVFRFISAICVAALFLTNAQAAELVPLQERVEEKVLQLKVQPGKSSYFNFKVPADAFSLLAQIEGHQEVKYVFSSLESPKKQLFIEESKLPTNETDDWVHTLVAQPLPQVYPADMGAAAIQLPRGEVRLTGGTYRFGIRPLFGSAAGVGDHTVVIRILVKTLEEPLPNDAVGIIDLNLHFSGAGGVNESNYEDSKPFQVYLQEMKNHLAKARLLPRIVSTQKSNLPAAMSLITDGNRLSFEKPIRQAQVPRSGLNVFFTRFKDGKANAVSMGLPGLKTSDKLHSGIVISMPTDEMVKLMTEDELAVEFRRRSMPTTHEIGHYLGLMHVCESNDSMSEDGLPDTECGNRPYVNTGNVMGVNRIPTATFTEQQKEILLGNPHVRLFKIAK